ncbi:MAG: prolyl oligopeptidase family serine peptidase [Planctomycetota bacterium]
MIVRILRPVLVLCLLLAAGACSSRAKKPPSKRFAYPEARVGDHVDKYGSVGVPDPYRWMEDPDSPELKAWIDAQNKLTHGWLGKGSDRRRIRERLRELWNYERCEVPRVIGSGYVFRRNTGLQNQSVLYFADALDAEPRVLLDPNTLSEDGTKALRGTYFSPNGRLMAYAVSSGGSDWKEIRVRDVQTGDDLPADRLRWIKFSGASWNAEGSGFFYTRLPEPEEGTELTAADRAPRIYYHSIGTAQEEDALVYERSDKPDWSLRAAASEDGRYLVVTARPGSSSSNAIFLQDLEGDGEVQPLLDKFDARYRVLGNDGPVFYLFTDLDAPRGRVVAIDVRDPDPERWREVIPQGRHAIRSVTLVGQRLFINRLRLARSQVHVHRLDGSREHGIQLSALGTVRGLAGRRRDTETFFAFSSFTHPTTIYRYELETGATSVFRRPKVDFDPKDFHTSQFAFPAKDGERITIFISHRKGLVLDKSHPTLLYGYGGFNNSVTPRFSVSRLVWMEMGGVYAVANIRGGGERGEEWHRAGMLKKKQNVFDDFIAAAEGLCFNKYTSPSRLAIAGRSNGGLLVGACINQRPDLFAAALPGVGVMDMLRFHKFTVGRFWVREYGSADDPAMFPVLYAYSPYHNIKKGVAYPATLVTTADHDDRVVPLHSFKYAAALQAAQRGPAPILIRVDTRAGHGAGTPTDKRIDLAADELTFLARNLRMKVRFGG